MSLNLFFQTVCGPAGVPLMDSDVTLKYMALWMFVCGAALVWLVIHLQRNAQFRKQKENYAQLRQEFKNILQHSREALYKFNVSTRRFEYVSSACFSLTGYAPEELEQMGLAGLLECVHPDDRGKISRLIGTLRFNADEEAWQGVVDFRFMHRDQQYRSFSDHLVVSYNSSGEAQFLAGSVREITQISRLEESLRILERKFHEGEKMAGLGLLASGIAHDFNNMMTVVLGNTELALVDKGGSDGDVLDEIKKTTLRAAELANQLLVYAGKTTLVLSRIDLCSVVREMGALLDVSVSKKVKIEYCLADDLPLFRGDVSQIRQVAMNLIMNASEAIGDRPGVIAVNIHEKHLRPGELEDVYPPGSVVDGPHVLLEISDTGSGIDEQMLEKIFDPHFTTKVTGRGLGLASLLNAVQRHNGAVAVKSEPGKGSVFRVYFPVQESAAAASPDDSPEALDEWKGYGTALIADDEKAILEITASMLKRLGFKVITAPDGAAAVDLYAEHAEKISFLLMDINMPNLNGMEAVLQIRHINPRLPVLFMSGYPRQEVMDRFEQQPRVGFIKKPFVSKQLTAAVRSVIEEG